MVAEYSDDIDLTVLRDEHAEVEKRKADEQTEGHVEDEEIV